VSRRTLKLALWLAPALGLVLGFGGTRVAQLLRPAAPTAAADSILAVGAFDSARAATLLKVAVDEQARAAREKAAKDSAQKSADSLRVLIARIEAAGPRNSGEKGHATSDGATAGDIPESKPTASDSAAHWHELYELRTAENGRLRSALAHADSALAQSDSALAGAMRAAREAEEARARAAREAARLAGVNARLAADLGRRPGKLARAWEKIDGPVMFVAGVAAGAKVTP
jgi:hypothetical protein